MPEIAPNAFIGKAEMPTEADLAAALGRSAKSAWEKLLASLAAHHPLLDREWHSYSIKAGWSLRLKLKKRNILYLLPAERSFAVAFTLGDKAVQAAREAGLPSHILKLIDEAKRYAEGTGFRLPITGPDDIPVVLKLAAIKLAS